MKKTLQEQVDHYKELSNKFALQLAEKNKNHEEDLDQQQRTFIQNSKSKDEYIESLNDSYSLLRSKYDGYREAIKDVMTYHGAE